VVGKILCNPRVTLSAFCLDSNVWPCLDSNLCCSSYAQEIQKTLQRNGKKLLSLSDSDLILAVYAHGRPLQKTTRLQKETT